MTTFIDNLNRGICMIILKLLLMFIGVWIIIVAIQFGAYLLASKIIRNDTPPVAFLVIAVLSSLFMLIPGIGLLIFPFVLLYMLCRIAGLNLWPPALLIAIIGTFVSSLVFGLLRYIAQTYIM